MKAKNIIKSTFILLSTSIISLSCSDYLDVNDNPNNPPISTPELTLPVAQQALAQLNGTTMMYLGQYLSVNWATPSNWSTNQEFSRYNITSTFYSTIFETSYLSIMKNLTYIDTYEDPTGAVDYSTYKAISATIKGFQYQYLVDLYGDIPFTEANQRGDNLTPAYDNAETVYKNVIDQLSTAASLALNLPENAEDPGTQDIIFQGDMSRWASFANTIKLRMLVRLSNTGQEQYILDQIALINANGAGYITENVIANPGYSDNLEKQNPFYGYFVSPSTGIQTSRGDYTVASENAITFLTNSNDNRLERLYAESANGGYKGTVQSTSLAGTGFTSSDLSKVGPGLLVDSAQDQTIMLVSESLLLQAEAVVRGYITGSNAETLYNDAITESFIYLNVDDAETAAVAYYTQDIENVSWEDSNDKIEAIITQKWVALNGTSSIELWIELTRTGFPANLPLPAESDGLRPVRLLYPQSEVARNSNNVPSQTAQDAFTDNPFWK
ncbi:SusD/RagB family nutrient-binding outer membrane lipoprotein [Cellulophaga sp. E16_2]|uniref:SusD/RagB family nutrient-binding outer membrane lipoprotein n=1 Tax=Cellulophaga sp. E16_2 TaxID=2789297 RepID=UPI001A93A573|nr:SusD/RagB family nutrient-binding outer membrane lipoprotein [Cellulophaga sp. E16_2]MBO0590102.1 SusD/RagB family nutrient-binding outer membrane lipoprotein [Cellulophaga sp. E16_2]